METQNQNYYGNDNLELEDAVEGNLYRDTAVDNREILAVSPALEIKSGTSGDHRPGDADIKSVLNDIDDGPDDDDDDLDDEDLDDDLIDDDLIDDEDPDEPFDIDDDLSIVDEDLDDDDLDDDDF